MPEINNEALEEGVRLERSGLLEKALRHFRDAARAADAAVAAEALRHEADVHRSRCDWEDAIALARRSAEVARAGERPDLVAEALNAEAAVHLSRSAYGKAEPLLRRMLELADDPRIRGIALQNLGLIAAEGDRLDDAHRYFTDSSKCFAAAGYERGLAVALLNASRLPLLREQYDEAAEEAGRAEEVARQVGDLELVALACLTLGEAMLHLGEHEEAERCATVAFGYFSGVGNEWRRVECLRLQGDLHVATRDVLSARRCYGRALELARTLGARLEIERLEARMEEAGVGGPRMEEAGVTEAPEKVAAAS